MIGCLTTALRLCGEGILAAGPNNALCLVPELWDWVASLHNELIPLSLPIVKPLNAVLAEDKSGTFNYRCSIKMSHLLILNWSCTDSSGPCGRFHRCGFMPSMVMDVLRIIPQSQLAF